MHVGVDYYPEHVIPAQWEEDARLMSTAGFTVTRIAEFAWAFLEPREGELRLEWLEEAIGVLARHGLAVIIGTPTASMPAWAARQYPECLATDRGGRRATWGVRRNNCHSSPDFLRLSARITRALAQRFGSRPEVIGWQTDNELSDPICWCATCRASFQAWLARRYGSIEALNAAWGTHFWGHRLSRWEEIPLPDDPASDNPGLCLDFRRHHSWLVAQFQAEQVSILRELCPRQFVTHNFMGLHSVIDYAELARDLDFVSWDNYPVWHAPGVRHEAAAAADVMRGLKRKNFWVMEQTAGAPGWGVMGRNPRPGEIRQAAFQQAARGADSVLFYCWRTQTAGREQYWHGLLGHDGKAGRRYDEAARTARDLRSLETELEGTTVRPSVAVVYDYPSVWAHEIQPSYAPTEPGERGGAFNYRDAIMRFHRALFRAGAAVDMIRPADDFGRYRVVIAPHLFILADEDARRLAEFVRAGGRLVADCRTAVKDPTGLCHDRTLPGLLSEALGISIEEYESVDGSVRYALACTAPLPPRCTGTRFADWVRPRGAEVLAEYDEPLLKGYAAVTRHAWGAGAAWYVGTIVEEPGFYDELVREVLRQSGAVPAVVPPDGVEAVVRESEERRVLFLINHVEEERSVSVPAGARELLGGFLKGTAVTLGPYGVSVLRLPQASTAP